MTPGSVAGGERREELLGPPRAEQRGMGAAGAVGWWPQVSALLWKELRSESRTHDSFTPMLVFAFTVVTVFGFGLKLAGVSLRPVFPGLIWISTYFIGFLGIGRSFAGEKAQDTLAGLRLVPADPSYIYVGKLLSNLLFLSALEAVSIPLQFALLGVEFTAPLLPFAGVVILGTTGFAAVGTLLSGLATHTRAGEILLPVLAFPVLIPAIIGAVQATASLLGLGNALDWPKWIGMLAAYDVLFVAVSLVLFDFIMES